MASGELGPLPRQLAGPLVGDAKRQVRDLGSEVCAKHLGEICPARRFRAARANPHVDERDVLVGGSVG